jgi:hypothetical protein
VVAIQPEQSAAQQKRAHLIPTVVEDQALPIGVETLPLIFVLVQMSSIEVP